MLNYVEEHGWKIILALTRIKLYFWNPRALSGGKSVISMDWLPTNKFKLTRLEQLRPKNVTWSEWNQTFVKYKKGLAQKITRHRSTSMVAFSSSPKINGKVWTCCDGKPGGDCRARYLMRRPWSSGGMWRLGPVGVQKRTASFSVACLLMLTSCFLQSFLLLSWSRLSTQLGSPPAYTKTQAYTQNSRSTYSGFIQGIGFWGPKTLRPLPPSGFLEGLFITKGLGDLFSHKRSFFTKESPRYFNCSLGPNDKLVVFNQYFEIWYLLLNSVMADCICCVAF